MPKVVTFTRSGAALGICGVEALREYWEIPARVARTGQVWLRFGTHKTAQAYPAYVYRCCMCGQDACHMSFVGPKGLTSSIIVSIPPRIRKVLPDGEFDSRSFGWITCEYR